MKSQVVNYDINYGTVVIVTREDIYASLLSQVTYSIVFEMTRFRLLKKNYVRPRVREMVNIKGVMIEESIWSASNHFEIKLVESLTISSMPITPRKRFPLFKLETNYWLQISIENKYKFLYSQKILSAIKYLEFLTTLLLLI